MPGRNLVAIVVSIVAADETGLSRSYKADDVRNIVLLDQTTGRSRRLLPENERYVFDHRFLAAVSDLQASPTGGPAATPTRARAPEGRPPTTRWRYPTTTARMESPRPTRF